MSNVSNIMTADPTGSQLVSFAEQTAQHLIKNNLTRSQIRFIFTEVRKIESTWGSDAGEAMRRLNMLKPKLFYQAARTPPVSILRDVLTEAITYVEQASSQEERNQRFQRFMDLFEAILAFHRSGGGRTN